jgi:hypothetical protein
VSALLAYGREAQNDPKRNVHGWYCCDCGELIGELCDEIERLQSIINAKLHRRRCHDCGHVGWYADSRTPYCLCDRCCSWLCDRCRSWDTRRVKEAQ